MKNDFSEREKYMRIKDILRLIKHSYHTNKKLFVVILFKSFFMAFSPAFTYFFSLILLKEKD